MRGAVTDLYRSLDAGLSWTRGASYGVLFPGIDFAEDSRGNLYLAVVSSAGDSPELHKSTDGGATWRKELTRALSLRARPDA